MSGAWMALWFAVTFVAGFVCRGAWFGWRLRKALELKQIERVADPASMWIWLITSAKALGFQHGDIFHFVWRDGVRERHEGGSYDCKICEGREKVVDCEFEDPP